MLAARAALGSVQQHAAAAGRLGAPVHPAPNGVLRDTNPLRELGVRHVRRFDKSGHVVFSPFVRHGDILPSTSCY